MEQRLSSYDVSFDPDPTDDEDFAPAAYLPAAPNSDPARSVERDDWEANAHDRLDGALAKLDARSRDILARRWLTDDKATLHELAAEYDVSAERIRQIEVSAIAKLRKQMGAPAFA
jgi:RNA polymerase sigma-32 factor